MTYNDAFNDGYFQALEELGYDEYDTYDDGLYDLDSFVDNAYENAYYDGYYDAMVMEGKVFDKIKGIGATVKSKSFINGLIKKAEKLIKITVPNFLKNLFNGKNGPLLERLKNHPLVKKLNKDSGILNKIVSNVKSFFTPRKDMDPSEIASFVEKLKNGIDNVEVDLNDLENNIGKFAKDLRKSRPDLTNMDVLNVVSELRTSQS